MPETSSGRALPPRREFGQCGPGSRGRALQTQNVDTPALGPPAVSHTFFSCGSRGGEDKSSLETTSDFCFPIGNSATGSNFL